MKAMNKLRPLTQPRTTGSRQGNFLGKKRGGFRGSNPILVVGAWEQL